jgi:hypothetical protein
MTKIPKPPPTVAFFASSVTAGDVIVRISIPGRKVVVKSVHWRPANNWIAEVHRACVEAERLEREQSR